MGRGPQGILDGVLVVRGMEVEEVHTIGLQPLKGGFQLGAHTLWLQRLPIPGVGLGSNAHCHAETAVSRCVCPLPRKACTISRLCSASARPPNAIVPSKETGRLA
ncbi:hypothetical protein INR49_029780 [Caranx melampygus]|nr:hypothetical protein INR49_029780 [Caranx melampygus]